MKKNKYPKWLKDAGIIASTEQQKVIEQCLQNLAQVMQATEELSKQVPGLWDIFDIILDEAKFRHLELSRRTIEFQEQYKKDNNIQ